MRRTTPSPGDHVHDGIGDGVIIAIDPTVTADLSEGECCVLWAAVPVRSRYFERVPCLWIRILRTASGVKSTENGVDEP
jgi:hypothetical protein